MFGWPNDSALLFIAAAFLALCYLAICGRPGRAWLKTITKTTSVALLALIAFQLSSMMLLVVALLACAIGDFFLSRKGTEEFVSAVGAFSFGHLSYAALFLLHPSADLQRVSDGWPLVIALFLVGAIMLYVLFLKAGPLRWAALFYVPVVVAMGILATVLPPVGAIALVLPAALLFVFSDFILAQEMFVLPEDHKLRKVTPYVIWSSYWIAQALFLISFTVVL